MAKTTTDAQRPWRRTIACSLGLAALLLFGFVLTMVRSVVAEAKTYRGALERGSIRVEVGTQPKGWSGPLRIRVRGADPLDRDAFLPDWHVYPQSWFVRLPLWMPAVLAAAPGAFLLWRTRRWRRAFGCPTCGYAWTGLAPGDGGTVRCPECGHVGPAPSVGAAPRSEQ